MLNALRHQWFRHIKSKNFRFCFLPCSTPYGINGFGTYLKCGSNATVECAQRLTASMVSALFSSQFVQVYQFVLNALRHQWFRHFRPLFNVGDLHRCSTPYGINGFGTITRSGLRRHRSRAQRLTASMVSAPTGNAITRFCPVVLNALRHQWFRHSYYTDKYPKPWRAQRLTASMVSALAKSDDRLMGYVVLNALQHQWFRHAGTKVRPENTPTCSTPYGINGFGTKENFGGGLRYLIVLNALRHQWFRHSGTL